MDYTEKIQRHVNDYRGIIVDVSVDTVKVSNGNTTLREVVHHPGGVCVAALDENNNLYMVRQYRFPVQRHLIELPAGKLEPGEEPFPAAVRELSEETGLTAGKWTDLGFIYTSPGFSTERLYLYLAEELRQGEAHPDENEFLDTLLCPLAEVKAAVLRGDYADAKTVAGVLKVCALRGL